MDKKKVLKNLLIVVLVFCTLYAAENFFAVASFRLLYCPENIKIVIFEFLLVLALFCILLGIFKSSFKSGLILESLIFIFFIVNQLKVAYTDESVSFYDFGLLNDTSELVGFISDSVFSVLFAYKWFLLVLIILLGGIGFFFKKFDINVESVKKRILLVICPLIIMLILFIPTMGVRNFMLNNVYEAKNRKDYQIFVDLKWYSYKYGVFTGIYGQYLESKVVQPDNYDENYINEIVNSVENNDNSFGKPNIVVLFAESFWDVDKVDEVTFDKPITSNFNRLKNEGILFEMISPSYGGVSANVEFEFLTGVTLDYFNKGYIPYLQLYNNDHYYNKPSIVDELNKNGYITNVNFYNSPKLFNCERFYKYLGVNDIYYEDNVSAEFKKGDQVSDKHVVDNIIDRLENKGDEKLFTMSLSMQSHMPYSSDKYSNYDILITDSKLDNSMNEVMLSYSQSIYDMDKELGRLYEYIKNMDEPTILIFYGDHLPYLKTSDKKNVINKLNYFNTGDETLDKYRLYNTESLVLANFDIKEDTYKILSPDLLGTYVINRMDIEVSPYYRWLNTLIDKYPASNHYVSMDKDGNLYSTGDLPDELKDVYKFREKVQYKYFIDNKN